jgi:hypothetical protein
MELADLRVGIDREQSLGVAGFHVADEEPGGSEVHFALVPSNDSMETTAVGPPNPAAIARLRRIRAGRESRLKTTRRVGNEFRVCTFGSTRPRRAISQFRTTDTSPAAPRVWPRAPLCD